MSILTQIKHFLLDFIYGKQYVSVRACEGMIYVVAYHDHELKRMKMTGLAIDVDIGGKYDDMMADVWVKITGVK